MHAESVCYAFTTINSFRIHFCRFLESFNIKSYSERKFYFLIFSLDSCFTFILFSALVLASRILWKLEERVRCWPVPSLRGKASTNYSELQILPKQTLSARIPLQFLAAGRFLFFCSEIINCSQIYKTIFLHPTEIATQPTPQIWLLIRCVCLCVY